MAPASTPFLIDTHAHVHYLGRDPDAPDGSPAQWDADRALIAWARATQPAMATERHEADTLTTLPQVRYALLPSVDPTCYEQLLTLLTQTDTLFGALSIHPTEVAQHAATWQEPPWWDTLADTLQQHPKLVAVGETGLDYYWDKDPTTQAQQRDFFTRSLTLAQTLNLPVIIHDRDAHNGILACTEAFARPNAGVMHCFSGDVALAHTMWERGYAISFAGNLTFKNAAALREVAQSLPLDALLVETDSPYLSPQPYRGKPNHPGRTALVAACLAELRGMSLPQLAEQLLANTLRVFPKMAPFVSSV